MSKSKAEDLSRQEARRRAEMILKVRSGLLSASEAAKALGVSRKTYYKWEQRGLEAMMEALFERNSGRPASEPDEETEQMKKIQSLEKELEYKKQGEEIRALLKEDGKKRTIAGE